MKKFSERLELQRGTISQREFARTLGVPLNTYTNWVRGIRYPGGDMIARLCTHLGVSSDWLLGLSDVRAGPDQAAGVAEPSEKYMLRAQECPGCAAKQMQIDKLIDIIHRLSADRATVPAPTNTRHP